MSDIGRRLRRIRHARGKSLKVIAGLAGISAPHLSRIENGERGIDSRSLIVALANALEVSPTDLVHEALPAPQDAFDELAIDEVRRVLLAVSMDRPGGRVLPVAALGDRIAAVLGAQQRCEHHAVGAALPALIRDAHTTELAGRDSRQVRHLLTLLHVQGTQAWLRDVGASLDLGWQATVLAQRAADTLDR